MTNCPGDGRNGRFCRRATRIPALTCSIVVIVFPESQNPLAADFVQFILVTVSRGSPGKLPVTGWKHRWWSALPAVPAAFRHCCSGMLLAIRRICSRSKLIICAAMFFINPPRKSSLCLSGRFWFCWLSRQPVALLRLISSWVHLSRSLAGLSTLPDQKLSWHAQRNSAHVAVVTSVTFTHQADIVSPPCKIRFSGWWRDGLHHVKHPLWWRSGLLLSPLLPLWIAASGFSTGRSFSGWSEDSPEFSDEKGFILSFVSLSFVFTWFG